MLGSERRSHCDLFRETLKGKFSLSSSPGWKVLALSLSLPTSSWPASRWTPWGGGGTQETAGLPTLQPPEIPCRWYITVWQHYLSSDSPECLRNDSCVTPPGSPTVCRCEAGEQRRLRGKTLHGVVIRAAQPPALRASASPSPTASP